MILQQSWSDDKSLFHIQKIPAMETQQARLLIRKASLKLIEDHFFKDDQLDPEISNGYIDLNHMPRVPGLQLCLTHDLKPDETGFGVWTLLVQKVGLDQDCLGVDIESNKRVNMMTIHRITTPQEQEILDCPSSVAWTLKEAGYKALLQLGSPAETISQIFILHLSQKGPGLFYAQLSDGTYEQSAIAWRGPSRTCAIIGFGRNFSHINPLIQSFL